MVAVGGGTEMSGCVVVPLQASMAMFDLPKVRRTLVL